MTPRRQVCSRFGRRGGGLTPGTPGSVAPCEIRMDNLYLCDEGLGCNDAS